jgi:hypothetical protein
MRYPSAIAGVGVAVGLLVAVGSRDAVEATDGEGDVVAVATAMGRTAAGRAGRTPTTRIRPRHRASTLRAGAKRFTGILQAE